MSSDASPQTAGGVTGPLHAGGGFGIAYYSSIYYSLHSDTGRGSRAGLLEAAELKERVRPHDPAADRVGLEQERFLEDLQRAPGHRLGSSILAQILVEQSQIVKAGGDIGMIWLQRLFFNGKRSAVEPFSSFIITLGTK